MINFLINPSFGFLRRHSLNKTFCVDYKPGSPDWTGQLNAHTVNVVPDWIMKLLERQWYCIDVCTHLQLSRQHKQRNPFLIHRVGTRKHQILINTRMWLIFNQNGSKEFRNGTFIKWACHTWKITILRFYRKINNLLISAFLVGRLWISTVNIFLSLYTNTNNLNWLSYVGKSL